MEQENRDHQQIDHQGFHRRRIDQECGNQEAPRDHHVRRNAEQCQWSLDRRNVKRCNALAHPILNVVGHADRRDHGQRKEDATDFIADLDRLSDCPACRRTPDDVLFGSERPARRNFGEERSPTGLREIHQREGRSELVGRK